MQIHARDIKYWIETGIDQSHAEVTGDGQHFEATVITDAFDELKLLERHRLVYQTLGYRMKQEIHALSLKTYTVAEAQKLGIIK